MSIARSAALLVLIGVGISPLVACERLLTPCYSRLYHDQGSSGGADVFLPPYEAVNGFWAITKFKGASITAEGVVLPEANGKRFVKGILNFHTESFYFSDDCQTLLRERGRVEAIYITQKPGEAQKTNVYWGAFVADHGDKTISLRAVNKEVNGVLNVRQFDVNGNFPEGFFSAPLDVHFEKEPFGF